MWYCVRCDSQFLKYKLPARRWGGHRRRFCKNKKWFRNSSRARAGWPKCLALVRATLRAEVSVCSAQLCQISRAIFPCVTLSWQDSYLPLKIVDNSPTVTIKIWGSFKVVYASFCNSQPIGSFWLTGGTIRAIAEAERYVIHQNSRIRQFSRSCMVWSGRGAECTHTHIHTHICACQCLCVYVNICLSRFIQTHLYTLLWLLPKAVANSNTRLKQTLGHVMQCKFRFLFMSDNSDDDDYFYYFKRSSSVPWLRVCVDRIRFFGFTFTSFGCGDVTFSSAQLLM